MIRFNQFSLARGVKPLFENTTFSLNPGEKAGLVGANGAGKSTLFAVLRGLLHSDGGDVSPDAAGAHEGWIAEIFSQLSPGEIDVLMRLLAKTKISARASIAGEDQR